MINSPRRRNLILLAAVFIVALTAVMTRTYSPFAYPPGDPLMYLPLVSRNYRMKPDSRFGVAEHTPASLLGLADADYISGQWRQPVEGDTTVFFTITERDDPSTWLLCSWSPHTGWYDENGCREWIENNPSMIYVIGNELTLDSPIGLGDLIDAAQYPQWYHEARTLILDEDPTALIAAYGPVGGAGGLLLAVWESYIEQFGEPMPVDFYPVHHYCVPGESVNWCWTKLTNWMNWLESHRGTYWSGPKSYWLTEWGLPAWAEPAPNALFVMEEMILRIRDSDISQHAWWPSCNDGWPDQCTLLVQNGQVTELGAAYLRLANE